MSFIGALPPPPLTFLACSKKRKPKKGTPAKIPNGLLGRTRLMDSERLSERITRIYFIASKTRMGFQFQELASGSDSLKFLTLDLSRRPKFSKGQSKPPLRLYGSLIRRCQLRFTIHHSRLLRSRGFHQAGNSERLLFEAVVPVGVQTADQGSHARQQIENRKERSPAFVLPYVNTLVVSAPDQAIAVSAKDDMPDGDGIYMEAGQQEGNYRAFCFDDPRCNDDRPA